MSGEMINIKRLSKSLALPQTDRPRVLPLSSAEDFRRLDLLSSCFRRWLQPQIGLDPARNETTSVSATGTKSATVTNSSPPSGLTPPTLDRTVSSEHNLFLFSVSLPYFSVFISSFM